MSVKPKYKEAGATAVEFALIVALFVTVLLGILEFGRFLFYMNTASETTRWGARCAVVSTINDSRIKNGMVQKFPVLATSNINITYTPSGCSESTCRLVNVSIQGLNIDTYIPFLPVTFSIPPFATTLPRESLSTVIDASHPNCAVN